MLINELARKTGVSTYTLRYYENMGLIQGAPDKTVTTNNYKNYDEGLIEKIELIKEAKEGGFTLAEIKKMLDSWYNGTLTVARQLKLVQEKMDEVDAKINQLKQVKKRLHQIRKDIESGSC